MIEIKNKNKFPVQVVVRSRREVPGSGSNSFTCLNIPGIGSGKNKYFLEDELTTEYVERLEKMGLISTKFIPDHKFKVNKGE
tara:strand:- start:1900 stop:2145 length:246 start_codon:yes stop_codon:yes gene_type:complete